MRLIVEYVDTDGCTYDCTVTVPVVAESKEKLHEDLSNMAEAYLNMVKLRTQAWDSFYEKYKHLPTEKASVQMQYFKERNDIAERFPHSDPQYVCGSHTIPIDRLIENGKYYPPSIYTIDEWFEEHGTQS